MGTNYSCNSSASYLLRLQSAKAESLISKALDEARNGLKMGIFDPAFSTLFILLSTWF